MRNLAAFSGNHFSRSGNHNTHIFLLQLSSGENLHSFCCLGFMFLLFSTVSFRDCHFVRQINFELFISKINFIVSMQHTIQYCITHHHWLGNRVFSTERYLSHNKKPTQQDVFIIGRDHQIISPGQWPGPAASLLYF